MKRLLSVGWGGILTMSFLAGSLWIRNLAVAQQPAKDKAPPAKAKADSKESGGKELFGLTKVHSIHLEFSTKEYEAMQPKQGGGFFGGFGGNPPPKKVEPKEGETPRETHRSVFGTEFPVAEAAITIDGKTVKKIGVRYKGNSNYISTGRQLKRPFKIDFNEFVSGQRFDGLKNLNLHPGTFDATRSREAISYGVYRAAGVPAPRTGFAEVTLTVPGKYDKELVGLYIVVEQMDKNFLQQFFKDPSGMVLKPERIRGLDYLGEDWERYKTTYQPKDPATPEQSKRLIAFTKLVNQGTDEEFAKEIASFVDVDSFLRFMACTAVIVNLDSFFSLGHNYYLYLNPETNKFHFLPWDVDLAMANFAFAGSADQQMDLSITRPYGGQSKLADRLMALKGIPEKYQSVVKEVVSKAFVKSKLLEDIATIEKTIKEPLAKETTAVAARKEPASGFGGGPAGGMFGRTPPDLKTFVEKRLVSIDSQLEGKSKGYVPAGGMFGGGGGGGAVPLARPLLGALDGNRDGKVTEAEMSEGMKKLFSQWDKNKDGVLDESELTDGLRQLAPNPKGPPKGGS